MELNNGLDGVDDVLLSEVDRRGEGDAMIPDQESSREQSRNGRTTTRLT